MLVSEERPTVNLQTKLAAWHKPDAEALFEIGSGRLLTTLAATEIPVLQRLRELAACQDASGLFASKSCPGVQLARESRRSENIESCKTLASEGL